jgi:hypothetical protein
MSDLKGRAEVLCPIRLRGKLAKVGLSMHVRMSVSGYFRGMGTPSKAARSGLELPQDLSNQVSGTDMR